MMTAVHSARRWSFVTVFAFPLCACVLLGGCLKKEKAASPEDSAVAGAGSPGSEGPVDELLEDATADVPHCTKAGERVRIEYKRMKSVRNEADFGFPLSICLNGLEGKTRNQIASVQLFVDLRFASNMSVMLERMAKQSAIVFRRQIVKTFVANPKGEQGVLEYALNPRVVFNSEKDICKLRVAQVALNMSDVKVKDFPIGPKWLPRGMSDGLGALGFNMARFVDEQGVTAKMLVPSMNHWLVENLATLGCDPARTSTYALNWDFAAGTSSGTWFPPQAAPTLALPAKDLGASTNADEDATDGTGR